MLKSTFGTKGHNSIWETMNEKMEMFEGSQMPRDHMWVAEGMTWRGDVCGEDLFGTMQAEFKQPYKRGPLMNQTHAIITGHGGGRSATFSFFHQYMLAKGLHGKIGLDGHTLAIQKRMTKPRNL